MRGLHQKLREQTRKQHFCRLRSRQVLPSKQRQSTCQPHAVESSNTQVLCSSLGPTKHCKCPPQPIVHSVFLRRAAQGANPSRLCLHLCNACVALHSYCLRTQKDWYFGDFGEERSKRSFSMVLCLRNIISKVEPDLHRHAKRMQDGLTSVFHHSRREAPFFRWS